MDEQLRAVKLAQRQEREFREYVPKTGLIGDYMVYTDSQESPGSFHFWTLATFLGAALERRAWISKGVYDVFPNLYTVLVAPTGRCRKSRAIRRCLEIFQGFPWLNIIADKTSPEALLQALMQGTSGMEAEQTGKGQTRVRFKLDNTGLISAGELSVFLSGASYNADMFSLLTDLYDCPSMYKYLTRNKKPVILKNPAITLLGGSTPTWLATSLPSSAFEGGFVSRIIFVVRTWRDRVKCWPDPPVPGHMENLKQRIVRIRGACKGKIGMAHHARLWFENWYNKQAYTTADDPLIDGFIERKPDTILKVALILCASDERDIVTVDDLQRSKRLIDWTQEGMFNAFEEVDLSPLGSLRKQILEVVDRVGTIRRREILRKYGGRFEHGVATLEQLERLLVEAGEITIQVVIPKKGGRPGTVWTRVKK